MAVFSIWPDGLVFSQEIVYLSGQFFIAHTEHLHTKGRLEVDRPILPASARQSHLLGKVKGVVAVL